MNRNFIVTLALFAAQQVHGAIVEDGLWTGNDWYDANLKIGVANGVPYSDDASVQRRITAPLTVDGSIDDTYLTMTNVQRISSFFTSADWDVVFPQANPVYTYDNFLKAAAKFPNFCNETNIDGWSTDKTCKRELATIFAHWGQETGKRAPQDGEFWTQALYWVEEIACSGTDNPGCNYATPAGDWSAEAWPPVAGKQYYGRGPFQLSWNYNYGRFSNVFAPSSYDSKNFLLENPELVGTDGFLAMAAAIWFYMNPQDPKPSMHDVMTGFFEPNSADDNNGITASFGTTTNVINGGIECGQNPENSKSASRGEYYLEWLAYFGLDAETGLGCGSQTSYFPYAGAGDVPGYWRQDWSGATACRPATYQTAYEISARDDYKRCVCDLFGEGAADCPTTGGVEPYEPEPYVPDPVDPVDPHNPWTSFAELEEIRANPHYSADDKSRTMYQVDREMDFIEEKLLLIFQTLHANDMIQQP